MARGFRQRRQREAARKRRVVFKWMLLIGGLLGLGWMAYAAGSELARLEVRQLQEQIQKLEQSLAARSDEADDLRVQRDEALAALQALEARYADDVPTGKANELFQLMRDQLKGGVNENRLRFLLRTASEAVRCDGDADEKRFIVQTGLTRGENDWVAFGGRTIIVRAKGEPVLTDDGRPQAWFDETKPVTVTFSKIDGGESEASGILPLHHSVIRGDREYRFVLTKADARGFLHVTAERCLLPKGE